MQTNEFLVRTDEARLQKFMRHVSPPPPANVQIRGANVSIGGRRNSALCALSGFGASIQSISSCGVPYPQLQPMRKRSSALLARLSALCSR